jgi:hypothetical protein
VFYGRRLADGSSSVWAVPKLGGDPLRISSGMPSYLVADDAFVYWTDQEGVYSAPAGGGAASQLFAGAFVGALALDTEGALYFAELRDFGGPRGIHRMQDRVDAIIAADQSPTGGIAVDATHAYYTSATFAGDQTVRRVPKRGGKVETLAHLSSFPLLVRVDPRNAYIRDDAGSVLAIAKSGGQPLILSSQNTGRGASGFDFDVNASVVWWMWSDFGSGARNGLYRANADGSGFAGIDVSSDFNWGGPRVDDGAVYYFHAGSLLKRLK